MQGITNGTFTELVSGPPEPTVGTELVSNITMPWLAAKTTGTTQGNPSPASSPAGACPAAACLAAAAPAVAAAVVAVVAVAGNVINREPQSCT